MPDIKITNMIKFYTLSLLSTGPKHGYELMKALEQKLERRISASNIYPFLSILRKNKIIEFGRIGKRDKKTYYLTKEGRIFAKNMFSKFGDLISIAIEPKLTICAQCSCKVYEGGHKERIKGKMLKFCCCYCANSYKSMKKSTPTCE